jgi:hypothetical protein
MKIKLNYITFFSSPWDKDRVMAPDINAVTNLLVEGKIWASVRHHMDYYLAPQVRTYITFITNR